jgi:putative NIF3 family GTP cyclohydrolase 1 type 2
MKNTELEQLINEKLNSAAISDYAPNGLQVEGKETVQKIVTGVTASQALLDEAVRLGADAVIVHHGYFWKGESPVIRGMKRNRLKTLLANDINLYGRHIHQTLRQSPDPFLASQRHRRFQFQHYRRFTYQITTRSLHFRSL